MHFRLTAVKHADQHHGTFYFLVDGVRVARIVEFTFNSHGHPQSGGTINLYLAAGQKVQIENEASTVIYGRVTGYQRSWFTGFLLHAV